MRTTTSASSSTALPSVWNVNVKPGAAAADRFEPMQPPNLRLDALGQLVDDPLVAAAHLVALVALAEERERFLVLEIAGSDQEDEVQRGLFRRRRGRIR